MNSLIVMVQLITAPFFYDLMQIKLDVQMPVGRCELYYIEDDVRYPLPSPEFDGSKITLYLKEYVDYELVIYKSPEKEIEIISITPRAYEIVDERDLDISSNVPYEFRNGILTFLFEESLTLKD